MPIKPNSYHADSSRQNSISSYEEKLNILNDHIENNEYQQAISALQEKTNDGGTIGHIIAKSSKHKLIKEYFNIIDILINNGFISEVVELLIQKDKHGSTIGVLTDEYASGEPFQKYCSLISTLMRKGHINEALSLLNQKDKNGLTFSCLMTKNANCILTLRLLLIIECLIKNERIDDALSLLDMEGKNGRNINYVITKYGYISLIKSLLNTIDSLIEKERIDDAISILNCQHIDGHTVGHKFLANKKESAKELYIELLHNLIEKGRFDEVKNLLNTEDTSGVTPSLLIIKNGCESQKLLDSFFDLLNYFVDSGEADSVIAILSFYDFSKHKSIGDLINGYDNNQNAKLQYIKILRRLAVVGKVIEVRNICTCSMFSEKSIEKKDQLFKNEYSELLKVFKIHKIIYSLSEKNCLNSDMKKDTICIKTIFTWLRDNKLALPNKPKQKKEIFKIIAQLKEAIFKYILTLGDEEKTNALKLICDNEEDSQLRQLFETQRGWKSVSPKRGIMKKVYAAYEDVNHTEEMSVLLSEHSVNESSITSEDIIIESSEQKVNHFSEEMKKLASQTDDNALQTLQEQYTSQPIDNPTYYESSRNSLPLYPNLDSSFASQDINSNNELKETLVIFDNNPADMAQNDSESSHNSSSLYPSLYSSYASQDINSNIELEKTLAFFGNNPADIVSDIPGKDLISFESHDELLPAEEKIESQNVSIKQINPKKQESSISSSSSLFFANTKVSTACIIFPEVPQHKLSAKSDTNKVLA